MNRRAVWACAAHNLRKWKTDWRIWMIALAMVGFVWGNISGIGDFARDYGVRASAWAFPSLFIHPVMLIVYGSMTTLLFCDAPFWDAQAPMLLARAGGRNWFLGQVLYIALASAIYTLLWAILPVLALAPNVSFAPEWGVVYPALLEPQVDVNAYHIACFYPNFVLTSLTPLRAMGLSLLLVWLTTLFFGAAVFFCNLAFHGRAGYLAGGILTFSGYFSCYVGLLAFGDVLNWFTPITYVSVANLRFSLERANMPSLRYAVLVLGGGSALFFAGARGYILCRDMDVREEGAL